MNLTPEVSVVMSVFNGEALLGETLESVLSQDDCEFELVVVDDGSTDATPEILKVVAARDRRVRIVSQDNQGITKALRRGCAEAQGRYVARLDCGDLARPGRLRAQRDALEAEPRLALVSCWTEVRGPRLEYLFTSRGSGEAHRPRPVLDPAHPRGLIDWPSSHPSSMFRRADYEASGGYRPEFYYGQDWDLWYRLGEQGWFLMIAKTLVIVRLSETGISALAAEAQRRISAIAREAAQRRAAGESEAPSLGAAAAIRPGASSFVEGPGAGAYFIGSCLFANRDSAAEQYLERAATLEPALWQARAKLVAAKVGRAVGAFRSRA